MMFKKISLIFIVALCISSCQKDTKQEPFEIASNRVGHLTNTTKLYQLDSIYSHDSIVKNTAKNKFLSNSDEIEIYEKGGVKLLILQPREASDSTSTIASIQVLDPRYQTVSGLSPEGYFTDIKKNYKISKINNTLSAAVIFVDSIQAYIAIDKKELPSEFKFNTDIKIEASKIPDSAKIKHFLISWDEN
ncbi:hypothetical protein [Aquimarina sp. 2201CG5-10]|uniref:hypothetical protein n=1 Tax=Aquimarina callyspongiae TaxID=3098150 RepID=UPI002AB36FDC|nr:hypothetical protein [Aquimarina sp. 2201CG5-10]MDY8138586.1 hypothetical protein [Aquimarina sp. 2201CG5-10]